MTADKVSKKKKKAGTIGRGQRSDAELLSDLLEFHQWEHLSGPHVTGLGQLQLWVSSYSLGVLDIDETSGAGPCGVISA